MTISDLLTLVGILLAIFAFISEKSREYVFLKFSNLNKAILFFLFIYIHFLISYAWWKEKCDFLQIFECVGWPVASTWAYIFSVLTLTASIWKIFYGEFPIENLEKVMRFYNKLILKRDFAFLAGLIEEYHLNDISDFIRKKSQILVSSADPQYSTEHKRLINTPRLIYGNNVFYEIILNETFIDEVADMNPYLFAHIIKELKFQKVKESELVNRFLKILCLKKNPAFFREIRDNQNYDDTGDYRIEENRPILYSLLNDINVAFVNEAYRGIGEQAITEMEEEVKKEFSHLRESYFEQDEDTFWNYRIKVSILYFDIMVRRAIVKKIGQHMWMFYYPFFIQSILKNTKSHGQIVVFSSRNYALLEEIISNIYEWKRVSLKAKDYQLIESIYNCLGMCIYEVAISNELHMKDKYLLINLAWEDLMNTTPMHDEQMENVDLIISKGISVFKNPSTVFSLENRNDDARKYLNVIKEIWESRDRFLDSGRITKFRTEVIDFYNLNS